MVIMVLGFLASMSVFVVPVHATGDTTPPTYSSVSTNTTLAGQPCNFTVTLADETGLANYTFGCNTTGPWVNETTVSISGLSYVANTTKTLNSTIGVVVQWEEWFADSSNNVNNTGIQTLTTTSQKHEYYIAGDNWNYGPCYGANWVAQTFTVGAAGHAVNSVWLKMYRSGSPSTLTVSIRDTDVNGHPTGPDLGNGTINANDFVGATPGAYYEIKLTGSTLLLLTKYAIVWRALTGNSSNAVLSRANSAGAYADGNLEYSADSGASWTSDLNKDFMFEVWGGLGLPSSVGVSTTVEGLAYDLSGISRKLFYADGLFWVFYSDGTNMIFQTGADGITWSAANTVRACADGKSFGIWFDGTYVHYAYSLYTANNPLLYCRGTPDALGAIAWDAECTAGAAVGGFIFQTPIIAVDSGGYPWIGYQSSSGGLMYPWVTKSSTNDGTWATQDGFPYQLNAVAHGWMTEVIPLTGQKVLAVYAYNGLTIRSQRWEGAAWGAGGEKHTTSTVNYERFSAVNQDDDVRMCFLSTGNDILDTKYTYLDDSWGAETTVQAAVTASSAPCLSKDSVTNDLYCFWIGSPTASHGYYKRYHGGAWDVAPTDWFDASDQGFYSAPYTNGLSRSFYQSCNSYIGFAFVTRTSVCYNIRFDYVSITLGDSISPTYSGITTNTTLRNMPCSYGITWTDETGLATTGGYIFGGNWSGSWVNDTWTAFSSNPQTLSIEKTLTKTGDYDQYEWWANDTSNNWNSTDVLSNTTTAYVQSDTFAETAHGSDSISNAKAKGFQQSETAQASSLLKNPYSLRFQFPETALSSSLFTGLKSLMFQFPEAPTTLSNFVSLKSLLFQFSGIPLASSTSMFLMQVAAGQNWFFTFAESAMATATFAQTKGLGFLFPEAARVLASMTPSAQSPYVPPSHSGDGNGGINPTVQISDSFVTVAQGQTVHGDLKFSWNYMASVTLTSMSFSGDKSGWVSGDRVLPITLTVNENKVSYSVSVPSGVADGTYTVVASCVLSYSYGGSTFQNAFSGKILVVVGIAAYSWGWLGSVAAWFSANALVVSVGFAVGFIALVCVVVAVKKHRR